MTDPAQTTTQSPIPGLDLEALGSGWSASAGMRPSRAT